MTTVDIEDKLIPFVKEIILLEDRKEKEHRLPFYADGYPGILYSETEKPINLLPINKALPNFFLYGQTIEPIQLQVFGSYKMIVFQLYPFATRLLLNINPKEINDACYDLHQVEKIATVDTVNSLSKVETKEQVNIISAYILQLLKNASTNQDHVIKLAISSIIKTKGTEPISKIREQLYINERTFERRFAKEIGVTPKQFARIIQFSFSLDQIKETDYTNLTSIAYDNGFADQSHFIRTFKKYTGDTPKGLLSQMS